MSKYIYWVKKRTCLGCFRYRGDTWLRQCNRFEKREGGIEMSTTVLSILRDARSPSLWNTYRTKPKKCVPPNDKNLRELNCANFARCICSNFSVHVSNQSRQHRSWRIATNVSMTLKSCHATQCFVSCRCSNFFLRN